MGLVGGLCTGYLMKLCQAPADEVLFSDEAFWHIPEEEIPEVGDALFVSVLYCSGCVLHRVGLSRCVVLYCAVLCCAVSCRVVLSYVVLSQSS